MKEETKKLIKLEMGLLGFMLCSATLMFGPVGVREYYKGKAIKELMPYVEMSDGKPGISYEDRLNFVRRSGLDEKVEWIPFLYSTNPIIDSGDFNFHLRRQDYGTLNKALESYKNK